MVGLRDRFVNKKSEILPLIVVGAVALFILIQAFLMPPLARLLPIFISTVALVLIVFQVTLSMLKKDGTEFSDSVGPAKEEEDVKEDPETAKGVLGKKFIGTTLSICVFVLIASFVDFLVAIFVFVPSFMYIMGARDWKKISIISILFYCFIYFAFVKLIRVPL